MKKVLLFLADDDQDDREEFTKAVCDVDAGIACKTFANGEEIMQHLEDGANELPDFIFLDLHMPKLNGRQCLERIKQNPTLSAIPVFIYTTSMEEADAEDLLGKGAVHFISKPGNPEEIYYLVSIVLSEKWK